jgi:hypothetical protein
MDMERNVPDIIVDFSCIIVYLHIHNLAFPPFFWYIMYRDYDRRQEMCMCVEFAKLSGHFRIGETDCPQENGRMVYERIIYGS